MSRPVRILLAGESWMSARTHVKGWDFFADAVYEEGLEHLRRVLAGDEFDLVHLPGHLVPAKFPLSSQELDEYDVVILSDIGANSLLLHPDVCIHGKTVPNRLRVLREWVLDGGSIAMCGGYMSFAGIYGAARYYGTPVEEMLPVTMHERDDRVEAPQGARVTTLVGDHPVLAGVGTEWPALLGYNEVIPRPEATLLAEIDGSPFLAVMEPGQGRSLVWTSDIGPHWCPRPFLEWEGYARVWRQGMRWLAGR